MSDIKDAAASFAARGYAVFPTWGVVEKDDGTIVCACPNGDCGKSSGKHPYAPLAPHGFQNATTDTDVIAKWPEEKINLGLPTSETFVVVDIDDADVTRELLEPDVGLRDECMVVRSGNGLHLYVKCAPTSTGNLYLSNGHKIGEVRAQGVYVCAPPSRHYSGRFYRWLDASIGQWDPPETTSDAYVYIAKLLDSIGLKLGERSSAYDTDSGDPDDTIVDEDFPFELPFGESRMRCYLSGTWPPEENDRSDFLFHMGAEFWRVCVRSGQTAEPLLLAGLLKRVDAIAYLKYTGRSDWARRYWDIAIKTKAATQAYVDEYEAKRAAMGSGSGTPPPPPPPGAPPGAPPPPPGGAPPVLQTYMFDMAMGGFVYNGQKGPVRICNFRPVVKEVLDVWHGPNVPSDQTWLLKMGDNEVDIRPAHRESAREFEKAVAPHLDVDQIVEVGQWPRLKTGMQWYSVINGLTTYRNAYSSSGWVREENKFLLPGAPGAITSNGFDRDINFEDEEAPERFMLYGQDVRPANSTDELEAALITLYDFLNPRILVPFMMQILGGPLVSLGLNQNRSIVHLLAKTGTYKTSLSRVLLSVFGQFVSNESSGMDTWAATPYSLQATMHRNADLPLLFDDYKTSVINYHERGRVLSMIQNYADGTVRTRMGKNQKEQSQLAPRCLLISTGEDVWEEQQSALARTIVLEMTEIDIEVPKLTRVQNLARSGNLQVVGYEWLSYLCRVGQDALRNFIASDRDPARARAGSTELAKQHPRIIDSVAGLLTIEAIWTSFLKDRAPNWAPYYIGLADEAWKMAIQRTAQLAEDAAGLAPYERLQSAMIEAISSGTGCLHPRTQSDKWLGRQNAQPMGYIDQDYVYLSDDLTYHWYKSHLKEAGDLPSFTWSAFRQQAVEKHRGVVRHPTHMAGVGARKMLRIPYDEIIDTLDFS